MFRQIEDRATRHKAYIDLLELLAENARDPKEIGGRVLVMLHSLRCPSVEDKKQSDTARELAISQARVSTAVKFWRSKIEEIQWFRDDRR
ncbi:MAG TPA: hypothetical protein VN673_03400 [Clostridia bacterium]|nr:hypothetical protein [Clostridia bacterium]